MRRKIWIILFPVYIGSNVNYNFYLILIKYIWNNIRNLLIMLNTEFVFMRRNACYFEHNSSRNTWPKFLQAHFIYFMSCLLLRPFCRIRNSLLQILILRDKKWQFRNLRHLLIANLLTNYWCLQEKSYVLEFTQSL